MENIMRLYLNLNYIICIGILTTALTACGGNDDSDDISDTSIDQWTWISGSNIAEQPSEYGTKGVAAESNIAGARRYATSWVDSNNILWLFGGLGPDAIGNLGYFNDLWKFDGANWTWVSGNNIQNKAGSYGTKGVASSTNTPGARYHPMSWIDASDTLWLFGGRGYDGSGFFGHLNDLWKFDGANWTWVSGSNTRAQSGIYGTKGVAEPTNYPGSRSNALTWTDSNGNFWLFGGDGQDITGASGYLNDLWKFDGANWIWISGSNTVSQFANYGVQGTATATNMPGSRVGGISWIDGNDNLWLFGGFGLDSSSVGDLNDLWKFDGTNWTWVSGSNNRNQSGVYGALGVTSSSNMPGSRRYPISWTHSNDNLWLFGGSGYAASSFGLLNDLWRFDGSNWTWVSGTDTANKVGVYGDKGIATDSNVPGSRSHSISWIDSNDTLWLFGGIVRDSETSQRKMNDLWRYQL